MIQMNLHSGIVQRRGFSLLAIQSDLRIILIFLHRWYTMAKELFHYQYELIVVHLRQYASRFNLEDQELRPIDCETIEAVPTTWTSCSFNVFGYRRFNSSWL